MQALQVKTTECENFISVYYKTCWKRKAFTQNVKHKLGPETVPGETA